MLRKALFRFQPKASGTVEAFGLNWKGFSEADSEPKERIAQEATNLLLMVAGFDSLLCAFDNLSILCSEKYNLWRKEWKKQLSPTSRIG
jgi:hypothetical protein